MKGSIVRMQERSVEEIVRLKNKELRSERERNQALEITNTIISAYLSVLVERLGGVRIPKSEISAALGGYVTMARAEGDDYVITVEKSSPAGKSSEE